MADMVGLARDLGVEARKIGHLSAVFGACCSALDRVSHDDQVRLATEQGLPTSICGLLDSQRKIRLTPEVAEDWFQRTLGGIPESIHKEWDILSPEFGRESVALFEGLSAENKRRVFDAALPERVRGLYSLPGQDM